MNIQFRYETAGDTIDWIEQYPESPRTGDYIELPDGSEATVTARTWIKTDSGRQLLITLED
jgi:hypothetical protein